MAFLPTDDVQHQKKEEMWDFILPQKILVVLKDLFSWFNVKAEDTDEFSLTTEMFKQQPGFISAQLQRGIGRSNTFFNYVIWESAELFKHAFNRPEFRTSMADVLPNTVMSSHLFKKVDIFPDQ